jgi:hypothetical protein
MILRKPCAERHARGIVLDIAREALGGESGGA